MLSHVVVVVAVHEDVVCCYCCVRCVVGFSSAGGSESLMQPPRADFLVYVPAINPYGRTESAQQMASSYRQYRDPTQEQLLLSLFSVLTVTEEQISTTERRRGFLADREYLIYLFTALIEVGRQCLEGAMIAY